MSKIDDGGAAFPVDPTKTMHLTNPTNFHGMSLRDWFAGQALPSLIEVCHADTFEEGKTYDQHVARLAFAVADAMIAARKPKAGDQWPPF